MEKEFTAIQQMISTVTDFVIKYSFQVIGAIIILVIGLFVARWVSRVVFRLCEKKELDITLSQFLSKSVNILILGFVALIALGKFGITIAPFVAALGAGAFGASFAIQGPLSNYGAGLAIIIGRYFTVGDTIMVKGILGLVEEVKLAYTILVDEDGVKITIPNKHVVGEIIHNSGEHRIVEARVGISYSSDPQNAVEVIGRVLAGAEGVASEPAPRIGIEEFADSSVNIGYRYWVETAKYFRTSYEINMAVRNGLKEARIEIPFPQRDVHVISEAAAQPAAL